MALHFVRKGTPCPPEALGVRQRAAVTARACKVSSTCFSPVRSEGRAIAYFKEATAIWTQSVSKSCQAQTVQGELLRAVEKLRDSAIRNGNGNSNQGFEVLLAY